jgi:xylose isomerase
MSQNNFFKNIPQINYEGLQSDNPLAFRWYDEDKIVAGKPMKEWFRFAGAYWHSFCGSGADPFGEPTHDFPWNQKNDVYENAKDKADAAFEFLTKLRLPFYCFHDVDAIDYGNDMAENERRLQFISDYFLAKQKETGVGLLWGTANLFSHRRYMNGAFTNPDFNVVTKAAAQVKFAIDATIKLNGSGYVFWGGREGYMSLLNTNMKREKEHFATFLHKAKDYARANGFKGTFFIEPKPCEPSKHQYDYDAETVLGFLRQYDLLNDFKLNLEFNHATLAGHTMQHEMQIAVDNNVLGSLDANRGDMQNGWDTDQFPTNINELTECMLILLESGGLQGGGINFDAKIRRNSTDLEDLFHAHIGGMDAFARALITADQILQHSDYKKIRADRYQSFNQGEGDAFEKGNLSLVELTQLAINQNEPQVISGRQEYLENIINRFI